MAANSHREKLIDNAPEPWRIYILHQRLCRDVRAWLIRQNDATKIPEMLAAADMLLQVTWCPSIGDEAIARASHDSFEASLTNMEHIAATAAAIQNIILSATEQNIPNYWSSGGSLRTKQAFDLLGIPQDEVLLGSVFFFPQNADANPKVMVFPGKMRERRSFSRSWCRKITQLNDDSNNPSIDPSWLASTEQNQQRSASSTRS